MAKPSDEGEPGQRTTDLAEHGYGNDEPVSNVSSKGAEQHNASTSNNNEHQNKPSNEKDVEGTAKRPGDGSDLVAKEDYSVFTVPQKRAIILAGSYISWFSPMTGAIYYPALGQVRTAKQTYFKSSTNISADSRRS